MDRCDFTTSVVNQDSNIFDDSLVEPQDELVDISSLEEELRQLDNLIVNVDLSISQLREEIKQQTSLTAFAEDQCRISQQQEKEAIVACQNLGVQLDTRRQELLENLGAIAAVLGSGAAAITHVPLQIYKELHGTFCDNLQLYIKKQFKEPLEENHDTYSSSDYNLLRGHSQKEYEMKCAALKKLEESLNSEIFGNNMELINEQSLDAALQRANELSCELETGSISLTNSFLRSEIFDDEQTVEALESDVADKTMKLVLTCQNVAKSKLLHLVIAPECLMKICRQQYWLKQYTSLSNCIRSWINLTCILNIIEKGQGIKIRDMDDIINFYLLHFSDKRECFNSRVEKMQKAKEKYEDYHRDNEDMHPRLKQYLFGLLAEEESKNYSNVKEAVIALNEAIERKEHQVFVLNIDKQKQILLENEKSVKRLENLMECDSAKKLCSINSDINEVGHAIKELEHLLEVIFMKRTEKVVKFEMEPYIRKFRLLWVFFLTNPSLLCSTVEDIDLALQNKLQLDFAVPKESVSTIEDDEVWRSIFSKV